MYFTGDLAGQYSVQIAEKSFADIHFILRCADFDTEEGGKTFVRNFCNIAHFDTVLTRRNTWTVNHCEMLKHLTL